MRYAVSFITDLSGYNVWVVEICGFVWLVDISGLVRGASDPGFRV